jgi:galactosyltransferase
MFGMRRRIFYQDFVAELRLMREEIKGLQDSIAQVIAGEKYVAPDFIFVRPEAITEKELFEAAQSLLAEWGPDYKTDLTKVRRYSELFFLDYARAIDKRNKVEESKRLDLLKLAIQCEQRHSPFQQLLFRAYQSEFQKCHQEAIEAFQHLCGTARLIVLHVSCRPRARLAKMSADTFTDVSSHIHNLIVVGHASGKAGTYNLNPNSKLLVVPANDTYEGLAEKSAAAYAFLAFAGNNACILKVDDDIRCLQPGRLLDDIVPLVESRNYIGRVWHAKFGFSRSWHFGKCLDEELNVKPYGLLADASYAEGPAYFLSPRAVHALGKASLCFAQLFEIERGYEDVAVGKVLNHYGVMPVNYDPIQNGLLASTDSWMMERAGLAPA